MNIFVCLIISSGIILAIWLIGTLIELLCDMLRIDTFEFLCLVSIVIILSLFIYTITN